MKKTLTYNDLPEDLKEKILKINNKVNLNLDTNPKLSTLQNSLKIAKAATIKLRSRILSQKQPTRRNKMKMNDLSPELQQLIWENAGPLIDIKNFSLSKIITYLLKISSDFAENGNLNESLKSLQVVKKIMEIKFNTKI